MIKFLPFSPHCPYCITEILSVGVLDTMISEGMKVEVEEEEDIPSKEQLDISQEEGKITVTLWICKPVMLCSIREEDAREF